MIRQHPLRPHPQLVTKPKNSQTVIFFRITNNKIILNAANTEVYSLYKTLHNKNLEDVYQTQEPSLKHLFQLVKESIKTQQAYEIQNWETSTYNSTTHTHQSHFFYVLIEPIQNTQQEHSEVVVLGFKHPPLHSSELKSIALQELSKNLWQLSDQKQTAESILKSLTQSLNIKNANAYFYLLEPRSHNLKFITSHNLEEPDLSYWETVPLQEGLCPLVDSVLKKTQLSYQTSEELIRKYPNIADWIKPHYGYICNPLLSGSAVIGAIILGFPEENYFSKETLSLLQELVNETARVFERSITYETEVNARKILELQNQENDYLANISKSIFYTLDLFKILDQAAEHISAQFFSGCIIGLYSSQNTHQINSAYHSDSQLNNIIKKNSLFLPDPLFLSEELPVFSFSQGFIRTYSTETDQEKLNQLFSPEILSELKAHPLFLVSQIIVTPLFRRNQAMGCVIFFHPKDLEHDLSIYQGLSSEITVRLCVAIENALLYRDTQVALEIRDEFFSIASHELKTPLTTLKLQIQLRNRILNTCIEKLQPYPALLKSSELENKQIDHLSQLINHMLDVVRIKEGQFHLCRQKINLFDLLKNCIESFSVRFQNSKELIQLQCVEQEIILNCDSHKISQTVDNLLSNAVKYGEGKPILIKAYQTDTHVGIQIKDHGPGIPVQDQARIFERFERLKNHHKIRGLGLGLYVVKKIIESHQGSISVESAPGKGTEFTILLPH